MSDSTVLRLRLFPPEEIIQAMLCEVDILDLAKLME